MDLRACSYQLLGSFHSIFYRQKTLTYDGEKPFLSGYETPQMLEMRMAKKRFIAWSIVPAALLAGSILQAQNYLPPTQVQNTISYYSGGIGKPESMAIKADASHHSLMLEFVERRGAVNEYSSGQSVEIQNAQGAIVLDVISDGPFLAVDLPVGHFKITASAFGQSQVRNIDLKAKTPEHLIFVWPAMKQ